MLIVIVKRIGVGKMAECMWMPDNWEKFIEGFGFTDDEEVYTNGSELVAVFRVKQMVEHYFREMEPVIRCKDCQHYGGVVFGNVCRRWSAPLAGMKNCTKPDDFCSYGERRTNNEPETRRMAR